MEQIYIGPCKCGGYGQCFDEKTEAELGVCHREVETGTPGMRPARDKTITDDRYKQLMREVGMPIEA